MKMRICIKRKFRNRNKSIRKIIYKNGRKIKRFRKKNISIENKNENENENESKDNYEKENLQKQYILWKNILKMLNIYTNINFVEK